MIGIWHNPGLWILVILFSWNVRGLKPGSGFVQVQHEQKRSIHDKICITDVMGDSDFVKCETDLKTVSYPTQ